MNYIENKTCLVCGSDNLLQYLDLGDQPLANSYHKGIGDEVLETYPLKMKVCRNCWHSQLSISVKPEKMFEHYLYVSDTSKTLTDYFKRVTEHILQNTKYHTSVLEIACNSGLLLKMFQDKNIKCVGVDPAKNIRPLSEGRGLDVYVDYWTEECSNKIKKEKGLFDVVLAFHVLPHVLNPNEFIQSCKNILADGGKIFIQTSQCDMFINNEFDVIYHEHSSYFTANSIRKLAHINGLYVSSIIKTDIHGKSFLFSLQKQKCDENQLNKMIENEYWEGITSLQKYKDFADTAKETKETLLKNLQNIVNKGYLLIGYGAAAKGNTLLNYIDLKLECIIDDNNMKCGYLTPGMNIPIIPLAELSNYDNDKVCFIPLAWNFYKEIKERVKKVRDNENDIFVKYFPEYKEEF
jgi:2-polyprenyl-3-methyl-5-hydroxy-6-metoxy-1,4-benzoquinol methylase